MTKKLTCLFLVFFLSFVANARTVNQNTAPSDDCKDSKDLTECVNIRTIALLKAKTDQTSGTKQTETPAISRNSTSLVDQSSAPDLIGVGLNLAGLSATSGSGDMDSPNSVSVTATAYSLFAALKGADPLNPYFYNQHRNWRRFSLTFGYDDEKVEGSDTIQRTKLFGGKILLINKRDPNRPEFAGAYARLLDQLAKATGSFGTIINRVRTFVFKQQATQQEFRAGFTKYLQDKSALLDLAVAPAHRAVIVAETVAARSPSDAGKTADAIKAEANAQISALGVVDPNDLKARLIRNALIEVNRAAAAAALATPNDSKSVVDAARGAVAAIETRTREEKDRINQLQQQDFGRLFQFEGDFAPERAANTAWSSEELEYYNVFVNSYFNGKGFTSILNEELINQLDQVIEAEIDDFIGLQRVTLDTIDMIKKAPQLSLSALTKQRPEEAADEYTGEMIFDWGVTGKTNITLNGAFEYKDSKTIGADTRGARFAAQAQFQLNRNSLRDLIEVKEPVYLYLASEGKWLTGTDSTIKGQVKLTIPIRGGIELPLSFTIANRTELIDEKEVRGQFGFTFDLAKLVNSLRPK